MHYSEVNLADSGSKVNMHRIADLKSVFSDFISFVVTELLQTLMVPIVQNESQGRKK